MRFVAAGRPGPALEFAGPGDPLIRRLDAGIADPAVVGGKGANLARLIALGYRVPEGFAITTLAFAAALEAMGLAPVLAELRGALRKDGDPFGPGETLRDGLEQGRIPPGILDRVQDEVRALRLLERYGHGAIIRSSATVEDSSAHSFAGVFESIRLERLGDLEAAVLKVWASAFSPLALAYLREAGEATPPAIAVVVQAFIDPPRSGVMFTSFTAPDGASRILIEHVEGPCHRQMRGEVAPARRWSDRDEAPAEDDSDGLSAPQAAELRRLASSLEEGFGGPQDVEWLIHDGEVYLVQTRPITGARGRATNHRERIRA